MELVKSRGLAVFLVVVFALTIVSSINTKKYDEKNNAVEEAYISMNLR